MARHTESQFGELLRSYREENHLSQTRLADALNTQGYERYNKSSISKWENGHTKPPPDIVETLEDILGTQPGLLLRAAGYRAEAEVRQMGTYSEQQTKETASDPRLMNHLDELVKTADILAHHAQRLIRYKDDDDIEAMGDVLGHLIFWGKSNGTIVAESSDPVGEREYENQHPVDRYLARCLYAHYEHRFTKLPFQEWSQLSTGNVSHEIIDNLKLLAHGGLKPCPNCLICKEIMD